MNSPSTTRKKIVSRYSVSALATVRPRERQIFHPVSTVGGGWGMGSDGEGMGEGKKHLRNSTGGYSGKGVAGPVVYCGDGLGQ